MFDLSETMSRAVRELSTRREFLILFAREVEGKMRVRRTPPLTLIDALDQLRIARSQAHGQGVMADLYTTSVQLLGVQELQLQCTPLDQ